METIIIEELEVQFRVGVGEAERSSPQRLLISVELALDLTLALEKDDLRWTVDYAAVAERISHLGDRRSWQLIETVAAEVADVLLREFGPEAVTVQVKKFVLPQAKHVAVRLRRAAEVKPVETRFITRKL